MIRTLFSQLKEYRTASLLSPLFTALEVIMEILIPFIIAELIDKGIEAGNIHEVYRYGAIMLVMAFFSLAFGVLAGRFVAKASSGFACNLREGMYANIQTFSFANIDKYSTAGLVTRMTTDVTNVQNAYQMVLRIAVRSPLMLICSLVMCFVISPQLSSIFFVAIVILAAALIFIMMRTTKIFTEVFRKYDDLNASVQENVSAIRVVKAFVREDRENEKFEKAATNLYRLFVKAESLLAFNNPVMMFVVYGCILALSWFGAHFIVSGTLTTGNLTSLFSYVMSVLMSLMMLSLVFVMITMSAASGRRIAEVLQETPYLTNPDKPLMTVSDGSIDFDHVDFAYRHGSGELVLQKNTLFLGTILDNLRWGNPNASEEECAAACRAACADEFIARFPDGYNTWVEQGGSNLSGGQKQRLCIARALLKKPKVLILDDSTSAVDTATDASIRRAFAEEIPGTTKLIVAQRISSVQDADRILVLDDGRVSGFDTHDALVENNAIYREIFIAQTQGGGDFDEALM